jgi:DNA modification methylase
MIDTIPESKIETWPVNAIKPNPRNARTHSKAQTKAIADSIRAYGFTNPLIIDEQGMILAGHGRLTAAKLLKLETVPAIKISHLSDAEKRAYVLADNALAARSGWDRDMLAAELGALSVLLPENGLSVELTGFEVPVIDSILCDVEEEKANRPDDEVVAPPSQPVSKPGDLWILGRHRLLCADARDKGNLTTLLGEEQADMVFTDPPYNVPIDGHVLGHGRVSHPDFAMASGEMTDGQFIDFLKEVLTSAAGVSRDGALHYVAMDWRHISHLIEAGKSVYSEMKNLCVWSKTNAGQGSLYRSAHELIAVFKVGNAEHMNNVQLGKFGRNRSNVWTYPGISSFGTDRDEELKSHPTVKPVALVADAIKDVTKRGAVILDVFGGSGTTLIAAERTGRKARLLEIEPRYADVTIARYEKIAKQDAVLERTGETFAEAANALLQAKAA